MLGRYNGREIRDGVILSLDKRGLWACDSNEAITMFVAMVRNSARMPSKRAALEWLFRLLTWVCIALLTVLSLTPGDYMVRTAAPGDLEHFVAYLGTGAIAFLGYERRVGALVVLSLLLCWSSGNRPKLVTRSSS